MLFVGFSMIFPKMPDKIYQVHHHSLHLEANHMRRKHFFLLLASVGVCANSLTGNFNFWADFWPNLNFLLEQQRNFS